MGADFSLTGILSRDIIILGSRGGDHPRVGWVPWATTNIGVCMIMKKLVLVGGFARGKVAERVLELLGVSSMYDVEEITFSFDGGVETTVYYEQTEEPGLTWEEAYSLMIGDEVYEEFFEDGYDDTLEMFPSKEVTVIDERGTKYNIIANIYGMDQWGIGYHEA